MTSKKVFRFLMIFLFVAVNISFSQDNKTVSFEKQNKKGKYLAFSFGGGANYCDNKSLKTYIEYELPFYNNLSENEKLSSFYTGFEIFGGAEYQVATNFSLKGEYSYFTKSYNSVKYPDYDFTYGNHQPYLTLYYLIPQEYSFVKIGAGAGYLSSSFTQKTYNYESNYKSTGFALRLDAAVDIQMSKVLAGYIAGYINQTFQSDLKDSNGNLLLNRSGGTVNLNSLGFGVRLGVELFFFNI